MPILEQPDVSTTIEEVKRRLIEETDGSYDNPISELVNLNVTASNSGSTVPSDVPVNPAKPHDITASAAHESSSDSDSSTETAATFTGTNNNITSSPPAQQPQQQPADFSAGAEGSTTVVYYMPNEQLPYKVQVPHCPLTLAQFKSCLPRKSVFKYYFKQHSVELKRPIYFEVTRDNEELPLWEGIVLAKLEENKK